MRRVKIDGLYKYVDGNPIINGVTLEIPSGKFFALLGPSGCGKTTLLRLIAGLEEVDKGAIYLGSQNITSLPVHKRPVNIVFQSYALFPHMTVFENIAYSLTLKKLPAADIKRRVDKLLSAFHLESKSGNLPTKLSGGEQQRVAIARAIIDEPEILLLDEPLAALDLKLRETLLIELIDLQAELGMTFIYVTHDQFEALTVADQLAIMNKGKIEQIGSPADIYEFPRSQFVAQFVGTTNILSGTYHLSGMEASLMIPDLGSIAILAPEHFSVSSGEPLSLSLRPEKIDIAKKRLPHFSNILEGTVQDIVYHGRSTQYNVRVSKTLVLQVFEQNEKHFVADEIGYDDTVYLHWQKENGVSLGA